MALICVIGYFKKHIIFKQILWEKIKISDVKIEFFNCFLYFLLILKTFLKWPINKCFNNIC